MRPYIRQSGLCLLAAVLALSAVAFGQDTTNPLGRPPVGSLARQRLLKIRLRAIAEGRLQVSLSHNRKEWELLAPDQREQYRRSFLAYLRKSPEEQARILKAYEKWIQADAAQQQAFRRRARWLKVVLKSFSPKQRDQLQRMPLKQRLERILQRKASLVRQGKLTVDTPPARSAK